jgi:ketosteroid isomerase-like protein
VRLSLISCCTVVGLLGLASAGHAQDVPSADSAEVTSAVAAFHAALVAGDSAAALARLAPDVQVLESGSTETLAEYRAHHLPADMAFAQAVPSERRVLGVTVIDSVAWVTATSRAHGTFRGRAVDSDGAELMVLTRRAGQWQIRAIHWSSRSRRR